VTARWHGRRSTVAGGNDPRSAERRPRPRPVIVFVAALAAACATLGRPTANLAVRCDVAEASVLVDDVLIGPVSEWAPPGHAIRPGSHRIEIRHPGYFSHYAEFHVVEGGQTLVAADLHPLLD
jgi:hypothetical protein